MRLSDICNHLSPGFPPEAEHDGWLVRCPAHDDTHASLRVAVSAENRLLVKCRAGCSSAAVLEASSLANFAQAEPVEVDLDDTVQIVSDSGDVPIIERTRLVAYLEDAHAMGMNEKGYAYAERRFGLAKSQCDDLMLGYDDGTIAEWALLSGSYREVPRLVVPFRDFDGNLQGFQARALADYARVRWAGPMNPEGASWAKYAVMRAGTGYDYVLVTEGPGDALAAVAAGFDAVAIRGAALAGAVAPLIAEHCAGRPVVLCGDADSAGRKFNERLAAAIEGEVFELAIPGPYNDLGEWCESSDDFVLELQNAVASARHIEEATPIGVDVSDTSDLGIARQIDTFLAGDLMYAPGPGFMYWTGSHWKRDETNYVRLLGRQFLDEIEAAMDITENEDEYAALRAMKGRISSRRGYDDILTELEALASVDYEELDAQQHLLSFRNGTVDLRTGELREHRREDYLTSCIGRLDYNPGATCPRWLEFIEEIFPNDSEMPDYIRRLVGYGITGSTREQCFAILYGRGANGKSVFTDTLAYVFDEITRTTAFSTFETKPGGGIPNDIAALQGARLVHASEGEVHAHLSEATLKRLTGQDRISARFMRQEFFEFEPRFLIMMATNHRPSFIGQDEGLWRRVKLVPFDRFFEPHERDRDLSSRLRLEAEGIIAWAVEGAKQWYADKRLIEPSSMVDENGEYRVLSDRLYGFIERLETTGDESDMVPFKDVWQAYLSWTDDEGVSAREVWTRAVFERALEERGFRIRPVPRKGKHVVRVRWAS